MSKLASTVGSAMARRHGMPGYAFATFPDTLHNDMTESGARRKAEAVLPQIERLLLIRRPAP